MDALMEKQLNLARRQNIVDSMNAALIALRDAIAQAAAPNQQADIDTSDLTSLVRELRLAIRKMEG